MENVVLVSSHYLGSKRRAGLHFLAEAYWRAGWNVLFFTVGLSYLSRLRGDHRFDYPVLDEANRITRIDDRLRSFVWLTAWHPVNMRIGPLNTLTAPLFARYGAGPLGAAEEPLKEADLVVVESSPGIMLAERLKRLNPRARFVYRVSDDTRVVGFHPVVCQAEERAAPLFDLISLPSARGFEHLRDLRNVAVHPHGLDTPLFDSDCPDPYAAHGRQTNLVSLGGTLFDAETLNVASKLFPDWTFHVFGWHRVEQRPNIRQYGEVPFVETIPYVKHADIGLALYTYRPGAEYLCDSSLKIKQYTYCRLPIAAPEYATGGGRGHVIGYRAGSPESIRRALQQARAYDRTRIDKGTIWTWDRVASALAGTGTNV